MLGGRHHKSAHHSIMIEKHTVAFSNIPRAVVIPWMIFIAVSIAVGFADGWKGRDLWALGVTVSSGFFLGWYIISRASAKK
jgi:hypothetical protein